MKYLYPWILVGVSLSMYVAAAFSQADGVEILRQQLRDHIIDAQQKYDDYQILKRALYDYNIKIEGRMTALEVHVSNMNAMIKWLMVGIGTQLLNSAWRTYRAVKKGGP